MLYQYWPGKWRARFLEESGQTMAEYGFILAGVFLLVYASVFVLGGAIEPLYRGTIDLFPPIVP